MDDAARASRGVGITEVQDALRLNLNWFAGGIELPGQLGSVVNADRRGRHRPLPTTSCASARCGRRRPRATRAGPAVTAGRRRAAAATGPTGFMQWTLPFGAPSAANWIGMMAQRHFHEFGTTREQLGADRR